MRLERDHKLNFVVGGLVVFGSDDFGAEAERGLAVAEAFQKVREVALEYLPVNVGGGGLEPVPFLDGCLVGFAKGADDFLHAAEDVVFIVDAADFQLVIDFFGKFFDAGEPGLFFGEVEVLQIGAGDDLAVEVKQ